MSSVPEHARAYLATPMTGLSESELAAIGQAADHAGAACVAAGFEVYDPRDETSPDQHPDVPAAEVYATDRARISESDVLVCIADRPSFGVGQEVTIAQARVVPVVLVAHRAMPLSRMLTGSPGLTAIVRYDEPEDIPEPLTDVLDTLRADIEPSLRSDRDDELRLVARRAGQEARGPARPAPSRGPQHRSGLRGFRTVERPRPADVQPEPGRAARHLRRAGRATRRRGSLDLIEVAT